MCRFQYVWLFIFFLTGFQSNAQNLYFPPLTGDNWDMTSPDKLGWCDEKINDLYDLLEEEDTKAFILLKDGKIVLEKYFNGFAQDNLWYWASAGKSLTAFLVGMAQKQGKLSIHDKTSDYLGTPWTNLTKEQKDKITIFHQLTMTTGLDDDVSDNSCTLDSCLIYKTEAGSRWAYHNAPYTLLTNVLENALQSNINGFLGAELTSKTGIAGIFISSGYDKVFYSRARNFARFGLLMLNHGVWEQTPILSDQNFISQMTSTSQDLNKSYGYLWWLNGKESYMIPQSQIVFPGFLFPNAPADAYAAMGKNGQFLNVWPSQNIVWIRMGEQPTSTLVPFQLNDKIAASINNLECASAHTQKTVATDVVVFSDGQSLNITIPNWLNGAAFRLFDLTGKLVMTQKLCPGNQKIELTSTGLSTYFYEFRDLNGQFVKSGRIIKSIGY